MVDRLKEEFAVEREEKSEVSKGIEKKEFSFLWHHKIVVLFTVYSLFFQHDAQMVLVALFMWGILVFFVFQEGLRGLFGQRANTLIQTLYFWSLLLGVSYPHTVDFAGKTASRISAVCFLSIALLLEFVPFFHKEEPPLERD